MKTLAEAFSRLLEVLDLLEADYLVGGSVASSVHGISRPTMDADLVINLNTERIDEFVSLLGSDFYADAGMLRESWAAGRPANVIHYATSYKFDLFPLQGDAYSQAEFARRRFVETRSFGEPLECCVATAEDTILRKLLWYRKGGESSERQWNDIRGVMRLKGPALDLTYLRTWAPELGVLDLLRRLLIEAG
jgi:hypothetical protein